MDKNTRFERLKELSDQLHAAAHARPYNPDEYNRIVDELNALMLTPIVPPKSKRIPELLFWLLIVAVFVWLCWEVYKYLPAVPSIWDS